MFVNRYFFTSRGEASPPDLPQNPDKFKDAFKAQARKVAR
jgi:hypothetical protein